jgi:NAD(P)-dependent dehydrogenase (short-subunit alcohol dehydrogenase family)
VSQRGWALVTGAGRRIGRALALAAGQAGYDVVVHAHSSTEDAMDTGAKVDALGRRHRIVLADLVSEASIAAMFDVEGEPVTLLVNCASVFEDDRAQSLTAEGLDAHYQVNLRAPVLLAQAFAAALPANREGLVVNIVDQRVWRLTPQYFSYTVTKAALWTATQTLAQALAPRIRVNAIGPGPTLPNIYQAAADFAAEAAAVPLGHGPALEEIGAALRYLIDAPSVTGQMIAVDGGQHLAWRTPDVIGD